MRFSKFLGILLAVCMLFGVVRSAPARAEALPERARVSGVVGHAQTYTLSCESRSAVDWAAYWGVSIREKKFLANLPRSDNPDKGFVGDPNGVWGNIPPASYGVHAEPVAALLREFGLQAEARKGMTWDELRAEIAAGRPVIAWVIGQIWPGAPQKYRASDGHKVTVARYEHTVIVIGYEPSKVHLVDAYTGQTQTHSKKSFLASWATLGNMVVVGSGRVQVAVTPTPAPTAPVLQPVSPSDLPVHIYLPAVFGGAVKKQPAAAGAPDRYVVRRGDYLSGVARRFGLDWRRLAELNGLRYPYIIYTGQVLRLK